MNKKIKVNEIEVSMDVDTLNKVRGKLKPTDKVDLTDKKTSNPSTTKNPSTSTLPSPSMAENEISAQPDKEIITYLSNVKDAKSGEVSKPFTIGAKSYQMVRGKLPSNEVVMAVYCHDDVDGEGNNIIHPVDYFEEHIAKPYLKETSKGNLKEVTHNELMNWGGKKVKFISGPFADYPKHYGIVRTSDSEPSYIKKDNILTSKFPSNPVRKVGENDYDVDVDIFDASGKKVYSDTYKFDYLVPLETPVDDMSENDYNHSAAETEFHDNKEFLDYLNLVGMEGYKHFFVNIKTGNIVAKFKTTKEMIKSGTKLGPDEEYMDIKALKRFRFGNYFKNDVSEEAPISQDDAGTNIPKLQSDVKKLADMIKNKFSVYLSKLTKPIQQAEFLTAMSTEIGVPLNKLSDMINTYKDISQNANLGTPKNTVNPTVTPPAPKPAIAAETKVITKKELAESLIEKKVIKKIKVKDIVKKDEIKK